jgi:ABC-type spermidine/putrescine transport system permease subunit II
VIVAVLVQQAGRQLQHRSGRSFTLRQLDRPVRDRGLTDAFLQESLRIAAISTSGGHRARFAHRTRAHPLPLPRRADAINVFLVLPLTTPEIVLGSSLAVLFIDWDITREVRQHHGRSSRTCCSR